MQVLGEEGLQAAMPYVRVRAAVTPTVSRSLLFLDGVMFKTPEDLDDRLNGALVAGSASCFQTIMTVYKENPFPDEMVRISLHVLAWCSLGVKSVKRISNC